MFVGSGWFQETFNKDGRQLPEKQGSCVFLCFNAIYRPGDSPELSWVLSYEPVHVETVVKLDGRERKASQSIWSWVVI